MGSYNPQQVNENWLQQDSSENTEANAMENNEIEDSVEGAMPASPRHCVLCGGNISANRQQIEPNVGFEQLLYVVGPQEAGDYDYDHNESDSDSDFEFYPNIPDAA